jgi:hypothetical protein
MSQHRSGKAVASLVLGILGLLTWWLPLLGLPLSLTGIILGALGMRAERRGMAIAGLVMSITALVLTMIMLIAWLWMWFRPGGEMEATGQYLDQLEREFQLQQGR